MEAGQSGLSEIDYGKRISHPGKIIKKNFIWHVIKYVLYYVWGCHLGQLNVLRKKTYVLYMFGIVPGDKNWGFLRLPGKVRDKVELSYK